eukprot:1068537-Rhodomonas_salina.2
MNESAVDGGHRLHERMAWPHTAGPHESARRYETPGVLGSGKGMSQLVWGSCWADPSPTACPDTQAPSYVPVLA